MQSTSSYLVQTKACQIMLGVFEHNVTHYEKTRQKTNIIIIISYNYGSNLFLCKYPSMNPCLS